MMIEKFKVCPFCETSHDIDVVWCPECMAVLREVEQDEAEEIEKVKEPDMAFTDEMIAEMEAQADDGGGNGNTHIKSVPTAPPLSVKTKKVVISRRSKNRMKKKGISVK